MQGWADEMRIKLNFTNMMADTIGSEHGITDEDINSLEGRARGIHQNLGEGRSKGELPFRDLPYARDTISAVKEFVEEALPECGNFVVIGIGGSALGNIALQNALNHPYYNLLSEEKRGGYPRVFFPDNVDPVRIAGLLEILDPKRTIFNVISKSGKTAETIANYLVVREHLIDRLGASNYDEHIVVTTDPDIPGKHNPLREIAKKGGYRPFTIPSGVGGRFSVFSASGLLSAAMAGIDIEKLLAGAAYMDEICDSPVLWENPAYLNAVLQYIADVKKGKHLSVMMPYSHPLKDVADWYRQLWAESLGKKYSLDGRVINVGPTPIKALGATDQHSQIQLYIEGPYDKVITFLRVEKFKEEVGIAKRFSSEESIGYLGDHSLAELINAEQTATETALTDNQRPNCTITLPEVNPFTVGQLLYMLEVQTAFAGGLYNINPFDQPGVEGGKIATYALMEHPGYKERREEILERLGRSTKYVV